MKRLAWALVLVALAGPLAAMAGPVFADSPPAEPGRVVVEALPPPEGSTGYESVVLSARVSGADGEPLGGVPIVFYVLTDVFGERLMKVGEAPTNALGVASLPYRPSWAGDHTVILRMAGTDRYEAVQERFQFSYSGPVSVHHDAPFGLESVRAWLPVAIGATVLAVWAILGFVVVRTVVGIPAAAAPLEEHFRILVPAEPSRQVPLARGLVLVAAVLLLALPAAWYLVGQRSQDLVLSTEGGTAVETGDGSTAGTPPGDVVARPQEEPLSARLVRSVNLVSQDATGQPALGSADLPADVALIEGRVFVLDSNRGRVLAITRDDKPAALFEGEAGDDTWFGGAVAMTSHDGRLYVANSQAGNVVVIEPPGVAERVIVPQAPPALEPLKLAGIAVTQRGDIWLSDAANHRILLVGSGGELISTIGKGVASTGDYGFDTPGGLALDATGNLLVVDTGNRLVKQYSPMGVFLSTVGADRLVRPRAAAISDQGTIFVSDEDLASVLAFSPLGTYLGSLGERDPTGQESGRWFLNPVGLHADGDELYVMDRLAGLFVFDLGGTGIGP